MIIKYIDILKSIPALRLISEKDNISFRGAMQISKNIMLLDEALNDYVNQKNKIDEKYLIYDTCGKQCIKDGKPKVKEGLEENYMKELISLNNEETEVDIEKIPPSTFYGITFPPKYIQPLLFMLRVERVIRTRF